MKINESFGVKKVDDPRWENYVNWLKGLENNEQDVSYNWYVSGRSITHYGVEIECLLSGCWSKSEFGQILTLDEVEAKYGVSFADKPGTITREQAEQLFREYNEFRGIMYPLPNHKRFLDHKFGNRDELLKRKAEIESELKEINEKLK